MKRIKNNQKKGAALLVSLLALITLSLIVGSLALDMNIESSLLSQIRKKFRAEILSRSGIDYARAIIEKQTEARELEIADMDEYNKKFMQTALYVKRGLVAKFDFSITYKKGSFFCIFWTIKLSYNFCILLVSP